MKISNFIIYCDSQTRVPTGIQFPQDPTILSDGYVAATQYPDGSDEPAGVFANESGLGTSPTRPTPTSFGCAIRRSHGAYTDPERVHQVAAGFRIETNSRSSFQ